MQALADALLQTRQQPGLAESIAQRAMITLATAARKKS
jgi:hypothetical protein